MNGSAYQPIFMLLNQANCVESIWEVSAHTHTGLPGEHPQALKARRWTCQFSSSGRRSYDDYLLGLLCRT